MSSKGAAGRATREAILSLLRLFKNEDRGSSVVGEIKRNRKRLWYMERKGYVKKYGVSYELTSTGRRMLKEDEMRALTIPAQKKWDGKWRLVMFDIPVDKRKRRDSFRGRLKEMGLVCYQNSVWAYPYPLENIINDIGNYHLLSGCVSVVVAESLTGEAKLRKHFKLK